MFAIHHRNLEHQLLHAEEFFKEAVIYGAKVTEIRLELRALIAKVTAERRRLEDPVNTDPIAHCLG